MRRTLLLCSMLLSLTGGCASRFAGEWIEQGTLGADGQFVPLKGERRTALQFDPISTVRIGHYLDQARAVDAETVQSSSYFTFDGGQKAQFGAMIAEVEENRMIISSPGELKRQFVRVQGQSIFPPHVKLPQFSQSPAIVPQGYAMAWP